MITPVSAKNLKKTCQQFILAVRSFDSRVRENWAIKAFLPGVTGLVCICMFFIQAAAVAQDAKIIAINGSFENLKGTWVNTTSCNYMELPAVSTAIPGWVVLPVTRGKIVWGKARPAMGMSHAVGLYFLI